ncbi:MAG: DUF2589 domain-containing protein [Roseburia sp.]|nr:DUF2589 domain-containing protein [Roseburia sp.]
MAIAEQFAGLQMDQLIGGPLRAAADANAHLANSTAEFINKAGFDANGKVHTVSFGYQGRTVNEDGTSNLNEMKVDVPLLAIVPIPNLQVDEVNILFDMEVKESVKEESSMDLSASASATLRLGPFKVSVSGNVSAHNTNTRSTDNSAKYHVDVRATNHGIPEGLARVLDMMAANVSPMLVGSTVKDGNGQELPEASRIRAEQLKALRQEIHQIEGRLQAARNGLDSNVQLLKKIASSQQNLYQGSMMKKLNAAGNGDDESAARYSSTMDEINQSWNAFQNQAADFVKLIADSGEEPEGVSDMFFLKAPDTEAVQAVEYGEKEKYYSALLGAQKCALASQCSVNRIEEELLNKKSEYGDAAAGKISAPAAGEERAVEAGKRNGQK